MLSTSIERNRVRGPWLLQKGALGAFLAAALLLGGAGWARAEAPKSFPSPESAVKAMVEAFKADNRAELLKIFGPEAEDMVNSGDETADKAERAAFVKAYKTKHALVPYEDALEEAKAGETGATAKAGKAAPGPERRTLEVGEKNWPFPIPLVADATGKQWSFDTKAGLDDVLDRRIGRNELSAIEVCRAYVDAQYDYYKLNPDNAIIPHFAARVISSPGKRDGLYWETKEGEPESPMGGRIAEASAEGYAVPQQGKQKAYHGYLYRILTGQGKHAQQGAFNYMGGDDLMFGGFALLAVPANYGVSGVMTFMVNQDGAVYEKNLGEDTAALASKITVFDPDPTWSKINEE